MRLHRKYKYKIQVHQKLDKNLYQLSKARREAALYPLGQHQMHGPVCSLKMHLIQVHQMQVRQIQIHQIQMHQMYTNAKYTTYAKYKYKDNNTFFRM